MFYFLAFRMFALVLQLMFVFLFIQLLLRFSENVICLSRNLSVERLRAFVFIYKMLCSISCEFFLLLAGGCEQTSLQATQICNELDVSSRSLLSKDSCNFQINCGGHASALKKQVWGYPGLNQGSYLDIIEAHLHRVLATSCKIPKGHILCAGQGFRCDIHIHKGMFVCHHRIGLLISVLIRVVSCGF